MPGDVYASQEGAGDRSGLRGLLATDAGGAKTRVTFDLCGGADQNQMRFRLTQAWASFGSWLLGCTDGVFMDGDVSPNVLDFWGPSGMIFVRDPQIRWTPWDQNGVRAVVGLEVPSAAIDEGEAAAIGEAKAGPRECRRLGARFAKCPLRRWWKPVPSSLVKGKRRPERRTVRLRCGDRQISAVGFDDSC